MRPINSTGGRGNMARVSRIAGVLALLGTTIGACGARSGLPIPDVGAAIERDSDGGTCIATGVAVEPNVPNLYFVLDISKSMAFGIDARGMSFDAGPGQAKWDHMRQAVAGLIDQLGANARFGATVFPDPQVLNGPSHNDCAPGAEIMALTLGDAMGTASNAFRNATATVVPNGGTPTASTFQGLLSKLSNFPRGGTFAILATDGGPNCNSGINSCTVDQCTTNIDEAPVCSPDPNCCSTANGAGGGIGCLDGDAAVRAVSDLRSGGVETYVMGIPGSGPYGAVLDRLAVAGGTARASEPRYYAVNSPDEAALSSAFEQIAAAAMRSCVLTLRDKVNDPGKVNIYVNGAIVPNGPDGWSLTGQTVTLQGMTCADFGMGPTNATPGPVRVTQGCPTVH